MTDNAIVELTQRLESAGRLQAELVSRMEAIADPLIRIAGFTALLQCGVRASALARSARKAVLAVVQGGALPPVLATSLWSNEAVLRAIEASGSSTSHRVHALVCARSFGVRVSSSDVDACIRKLILEVEQGDWSDAKQIFELYEQLAILGQMGSGSEARAVVDDIIGSLSADHVERRHIDAAGDFPLSPAFGSALALARGAGLFRDSTYLDRLASIAETIDEQPRLFEALFLELEGAGDVAIADKPDELRRLAVGTGTGAQFIALLAGACSSHSLRTDLVQLALDLIEECTSLEARAAAALLWRVAPDKLEAEYRIRSASRVLDKQWLTDVVEGSGSESPAMRQLVMDLVPRFESESDRMRLLSAVAPGAENDPGFWLDFWQRAQRVRRAQLMGDVASIASSRPGDAVLQAAGEIAGLAWELSAARP